MSFLTDENVFQKCLNASLARKPFFSEICSDRATDNDDDNTDDDDNDDDDTDDDDNDEDADADDNGVKKTRSVSFSFEKKTFFQT